MFFQGVGPMQRSAGLPDCVRRAVYPRSRASAAVWGWRCTWHCEQRTQHAPGVSHFSVRQSLPSRAPQLSARLRAGGPGQCLQLTLLFRDVTEDNASVVTFTMEQVNRSGFLRLSSNCFTRLIDSACFKKVFLDQEHTSFHSSFDSNLLFSFCEVLCKTCINGGESRWV